MLLGLRSVSRPGKWPFASLRCRGMSSQTQPGRSKTSQGVGRCNFWGGDVLWSFKEAFHILSQFKIETPSSEQNDSQHSAPAKRHRNTRQKCDITKHVGGKLPTKPSNGMAQLTAGIFQRGGSRRRRQRRPILNGGDGAQRRVRPRRRPIGWQHTGQPCPRPPICAKHC